MARKGQSVLSIAVNEDIKSRFQDLFIESQCNSKGDFLNQLLIDFELHDPEQIERLENEINILKSTPNQEENLQEEITNLQSNLTYYESNLANLLAEGVVKIGDKTYKINNEREALYGLIQSYTANYLQK